MTWLSHQEIEDEARRDWIRERPSLADTGDAYDPACDGDHDGRPQIAGRAGVVLPDAAAASNQTRVPA